MPKSAGLPVEIGGERADRLLRGILYFLDEDYPQSGVLAQKYVLPTAIRHDISEPAGDKWRISAPIRTWFVGLPEPTKVKVLHAIVLHLLTNSGDLTKKIVSRTLKRHHLTFLQGSFFDTRISEYRTVFHAYQTDTRVGEGGNGTVWKVRRDDYRPFAMKVLTKVDLLSSRRDRFSNELWFCAHSNHPNIVKVLDWGLSTVGGQPFYVMPLLNSSLRKLIDDGIEPDKVPKLFATALAGVEAAHKQNIWHRDLKPENLLYDKNSESLVVADFGIAHFAADAMKTKVNTQRERG